MPKVSVTILTKNSSKRIKKCLDSLSRFEDIVALDNGSTDETIEIAESYPNVRVFRSEFIGFGPLRNLAANYARNDWILCIDSDEVVTPEFANAVLGHQLQDDQVGTVLRLNHYHGRLIDGCGWQDDISHRLYNRTVTKWGDHQVHEDIHPTVGGAVLLSGNLLHFPFENAADLAKKEDQYTRLYAEQNRLKKRSSRFRASISGASAFLRSYIKKRGFLYGRDGLEISSSIAAGAREKYLKLIEANKQLTTSLIISTYNSADVLNVVLNSVLEQSEMPEEIVIADDGSTDHTKEVVDAFRAKCPVTVVHKWQENRGFRSSRLKNMGIAAVSGEYIILLDGDMLLHRDFVRDHKRWALKGYFLQGSRVWLKEKDVDELIADPAKKLPLIFSLGNRFNAIHSVLLSNIFSRRDSTLRGTKSCNLSFFKEDCYRINGFDESFEGWGREDTDFAVRLMNSGVKRRNLRFAGVAYHLSHPVRSRDRLSQNDKLLQRSIEEKATYRENGLVKGQAVSR